jgi:predicted phage terminase large subunit-like protein
MSIDCSFDDTDGSDYVVLGVLARRGAEVWLLDLERDKMDFEETCRRLTALAAKWPQAALKIIEKKANGAAVLTALRKQVPGMVPYSPTESKEARARAISPYVEAGDVWLPHASLAPWVGGFVHECATFPNGVNDDQVDMLTQALIRLLLEGGGGGDFLAEMEAANRQPTGDGDAATGGTYWASTDHELDALDSPMPALASR